MAASAVQVRSEAEVLYEPPSFDEVGDVVELTRGNAADDTADMKKYYY